MDAASSWTAGGVCAVVVIDCEEKTYEDLVTETGIESVEYDVYGALIGLLKRRGD